MVLRPPVVPMLAQARDTVPAPGALPGELRFQPKFDGYRVLVFAPWPAPGPLLLQSRRGSLLQDRFPEIVAAAAHLSDGLVLDGELIVWAEDKISFEALQRRAVSGGRTAARLAQEMPAHFIAFDLLQLDGQELLHVPYGERRARLEHPFTDRGLSAPWTLCPKTTEVATAQEWLASWTQVPGVEGLVIRGSGQRYLPGARALYKVRRRDTTEAVIGAITGMPPTTCDAGRLTGTVSGSGVDHEGRAELEVLPGVEPGPRFTGASPSGTLRRPIRPARRPLSCRDWQQLPDRH